MDEFQKNVKGKALWDRIISIEKGNKIRDKQIDLLQAQLDKAREALVNLSEIIKHFNSTGNGNTR